MNPAITLDQQYALKTAAVRLERDFAGAFNVETIERFLHSSYDQFAGQRRTPSYNTIRPERRLAPAPMFIDVHRAWMPDRFFARGRCARTNVA